MLHLIVVTTLFTGIQVDQLLTRIPIATTIIFETDANSHHSISYRKLLAVSLGFGVAFLSLL